MLPYWLLFLIFAAGAIRFSMSHPWRAPAGEVVTGPTVAPGHSPTLALRPLPTEPRRDWLAFAAVIPVLMIGLRYDVGTDWGVYTAILDDIHRRGLAWAVTRIDPGYALLNWVTAKTGAGIWLVNLICGILFMLGLTRFARQQPNPWLAIAVAVPYFVIAVGMGYSRQAVAIALGMAGLAALTRGSFTKFLLWVLAGAMFHRTAIILVPLAALSYSRNWLQAVAIVAVGILLGYYVLNSAQGIEHFQRLYVHRVYQSEGAGIRLAMNVPPALLYLIAARRFAPERIERRMWLSFALIAVVSFLAWGLTASTTALDRLALYIIPLQIFVFARIESLSSAGKRATVLVIATVLYSAMVQFVWLNYSNNAQNWLPYRLYPLPT